SGVNVPEVSVVEDIVNLPAQLNLAFLTQLDVLENCQIIIEYRRHANAITRAVADLSERCRTGKTTGVDDEGKASRIRAADSFHRIADYVWTRVDLTTGKVRNHRAHR